MGDYQFYQVTPEGKPAPEMQATKPYRSPILPWVFLGLVIAMLVGALVFAVNVIKSSGWSADTRNAVEIRIEEGMAECTENGTAEADCAAIVRTDVADEFGDARLCKELSREANVNCVTVIAFESLDAKVCGLLDGEDKSACQDLVFATRAGRENDPKLCEEIGSPDRKAVCLTDFVSMTPALISALATNDPGACSGLETEDERIRCIDEFQNRDTDGDGYSDYEEVQNGFSPTE